MAVITQPFCNNQSLDFPHSSGPKWKTPVSVTYCLKTMSSSALLFLWWGNTSLGRENRE